MDVEAGERGEDESGVQISQSTPPLVKTEAGLRAPEEAALIRNVRKQTIILHFVRNGSRKNTFSTRILY